VTPHSLSPLNPFLPWSVALLAPVLHAFGQSDPPLDYYGSAIGQTGAALKSSLPRHHRRSHCLALHSRSHRHMGCAQGPRRRPANAANVLLIYSGYTVLKSEQRTGSSGIWDREHLWPQSFGLIALNANSRARTDVFNLRPCDVSVNSSRGNKYYDETTPPGSSYPDAPLSSYDADSWEPRSEEKGLIARSMFYMAVRYDGSDPDVPDLELSDTPNPALYRFGKLTTLLAWHRQFPPTDVERARNQRIYSDYQHNRNPFIDHPEFADMVFSGASPMEAWRGLHFTSTELNDPTQSGDTADLDRDGLATLLVYTFRSDPRSPNTAALITASAALLGNAYYLDLTFPHNRFATDVTLTCEASSDLQTWAVASTELVSATPTSFDTEQVTLRVSAILPSFFLRLRITQP
jgi:endonuclease I